MKDREVYEQLGGKMEEHQPSADCPIKSLHDKSLLDEQGECDEWDREVSFKTESGEGKVSSFYSGEYHQDLNTQIACAAIALACSIKKKYGEK